MYPAAVSGRYPNNKLFSTCSKHNIFPSLRSKAPLCFEEEKDSFCGNYQVCSVSSFHVLLNFSLIAVFWNVIQRI